MPFLFFYLSDAASDCCVFNRAPVAAVGVCGGTLARVGEPQYLNQAIQIRAHLIVILGASVEERQPGGRYDQKPMRLDGKTGEGHSYGTPFESALAGFGLCGSNQNLRRMSKPVLRRYELQRIQ